jgi:hypothetical protein
MEQPDLSANLYLNADLENRHYCVRSQVNTTSKRVAFCFLLSAVIIIIYIGIVHTLRLLLEFYNTDN